jgi:ankyrin repeat protein
MYKYNDFNEKEGDIPKLLRLYKGVNHATLVEVAIKLRRVKFLDYLLKKENVLEQRHMLMAVNANAPRVIKYLIRKGLKMWDSYLVRARVEVAKTLVRLGADVNVKDEEGWSPLARSIQRVAQPKVVAAVIFLLDNGADVNSTDNLGHTPLIVCVKKRGFSEMDDLLKVLFRRGADERAKDSNGLSIKRILLARGCWGCSKETRVLRDGTVVPNLGGRIYKKAAPILNRVQIWRDKQCFSRVCTTFYCIWKSSTSSVTPQEDSTETSTMNTIKKPRTSCNTSVLEAEVDILRLIFSFF